MSSKPTLETIIDLISTNDRAVEKAILAIQARQTADEQTEKTTKHSNGMGWASSDARTGAYYAQWINSGRHLTGIHLQKARKLANKYRGQLLIVATARWEANNPQL